LNYNLNIITLDIPYPPDYGGMIDTYYRIQSLYDLGIRVHLHCFEYGRPHSRELESICETIRYYPRKTGFLSHFSIKPYIVSSRKSMTLLKNLTREDFPILFDGLHTTYYINHPSLSDRRRFVRVHNIEHRYYENLAKHESDLTKKLFFKVEALRLKRYEKVLDRINCLFPISNSDQKYFSEKYHNSKLITPFHPFKNVECMTGFGDYLLYHGDLSVSENAFAVNFLIDNLFSKVPFKCIIAGKNPSKQLLAKAYGHSNINIVSNPEKNDMTQLIRNAHINILPAIEISGYKIKLLYALFEGRHCIVNSKMIFENKLASLCHVSDSDDETIRLIHQLMQEEFSENMIQERMKLLPGNYSNQINSKKLIDLIFNSPFPSL